MRSLFAIVAGALAVTTVAAAQEVKPGSGRFAIEPSMDGFVRLDTATGAVSHCTRREGVWHCDVIADDRTALSGQVKALSAEVARLTKEVADLRARVGDAPAAVDNKASPSGDEEMDKALGFTEKLMRSLFGMVRELKREEANGT
jgi:hypothetical protein